MHIVSDDIFHPVFFRQFHQHGNDFLLSRKDVGCSAGLVGFVPLKFDVKITGKTFLKPQNSVFGCGNVPVKNMLRYFARNAG